MPEKDVGEFITKGYGETFSHEAQKMYGFDNEKPVLIFASPFLSKALAFGIQGGLQEKILNYAIESSNNKLVIACDRFK